jgi:hypothetical protein
MRRTTFVVIAGVWLLLAWPARANAWWGWIDELTGPKGLHGPQLDVRLKCFTPDSDAVKKSDRTVGVRLSLCTRAEEEHRMFAIAFGGRLFYATDNSPELEGAPEAYANGHRMYLFTAVPMLEYRPFHSNDLQKFDYIDYIDLTGGAGYYRISSDGFKPLQGTLLEARATFRAPVRFTLDHPWARAIPQVSIGPIGFVDGFKANAFGPLLQGDKARAKHEGGIDWTWQYAFFFELLPAPR